MNCKSTVVSIIVPIYKVEKFLERCVNSICAQTYKNLEIILVDDGSPDKCPQMCDDFARKDNRIKVVHTRNGGLSSARNVGIENSTGEWLMFVDSDDYIDSEMVQKLYDSVQQFDTKIAFCTLTAFIEDENGYREFQLWGAPSLEVRDGNDILKESIEHKNGLFGGHLVIACNKIYHRSIFQDVRFPEGQLHEDEAVVHRILSCCGKIVAIGDSLYYYRQRGDSIIGNIENPLRPLSISLAYGDRMLFFFKNGYCIPIKKLLDNYWITLIINYHRFKKDLRCLQLNKKLRKQMIDVKRIINKSSDMSIIKKIFISCFCKFPNAISRTYSLYIKVRNKNNHKQQKGGINDE